MNICKDIKVEGKHGRPFLLDSFFIKNQEKKPILILAHGFKGFKDWGHWDILAQHFAQAGYYFVKFNFSFNGTTLASPLDFADLEAFGMNNYTKEDADIDVVLEWLYKQDATEFDLHNITLIGHSRGGGLAITKAARDERIHRLITWAAVAELGFANRYPKILKNWKEMGVHYVVNGRTKQKMPLYYQLHEDIIQHSDTFNVEKQARLLTKSWLIIHGTDDAAVDISKAHLLQSWNKNAELFIIKNANHVFGGSHPFSSVELPPHSKELLNACLNFLKQE